VTVNVDDAHGEVPDELPEEQPEKRRLADHPWLNGVIGAVVAAVIGVGGAVLLTRADQIDINLGGPIPAPPAETVTITEPAETVTATHTVTVTPRSTPTSDVTDPPGPREAGPTYLSELEAAGYDGGYDIGDAEVVGELMTRSMLQDLSCNRASKRIEWNLSGDYTMFTARAGLDAESPNNDAAARFRVLVDQDESLAEADLGMRDVEMFEVDVTGRQRLILEIVMLGDDACWGGPAVWGDAAIT
jgi:hypothetical protein